MTEASHEWMEVGLRRWCLGCSAFQTRRPYAPWSPPVGTLCPCSTPYAERRAAAAQHEAAAVTEPA
jgi:hypothetical protein